MTLIWQFWAWIVAAICMGGGLAILSALCYVLWLFRGWDDDES